MRIERHDEERQIISLEQGIAQTTYLFNALRACLVDLGGQPCDWRGQLRSAPLRVEGVRWRDRNLTTRFLDCHPILTGLVWLAIMLPRGLLALIRRR